jgi:hypothetical protein
MDERDRAGCYLALHRLEGPEKALRSGWSWIPFEVGVPTVLLVAVGLFLSIGPWAASAAASPQEIATAQMTVEWRDSPRVLLSVGIVILMIGAARGAAVGNLTRELSFLLTTLVVILLTAVLLLTRWEDGTTIFATAAAASIFAWLLQVLVPQLMKWPTPPTNGK